MSAVSKKLTPASSAASTTAAVAPASMRQPKLLHPNPTTETSKDPIRRFSITSLPDYPDFATDTNSQPNNMAATPLRYVPFQPASAFLPVRRPSSLRHGRQNLRWEEHRAAAARTSETYARSTRRFLLRVSGVRSLPHLPLCGIARN